MAEHDCGPDGGDAAFFNEVAPIFEKFPDAARKYVIRCIDHETDIMNIDFTKMIGMARIEGDRVITEFLDRKKTLGVDAAGAAPVICCQWEHTGSPGGGTWTCTQRW
jgi:hypothetical protein